MTKEEIEELKGLAASMGLYDDKTPCKRAIILGKAIEELDKIEKYQQAIHDIKTEINTAYASSFVTRPDSTAFTCGLELAFDIINKYTKKVNE